MHRDFSIFLIFTTTSILRFGCPQTLVSPYLTVSMNRSVVYEVVGADVDLVCDFAVPDTLVELAGISYDELVEVEIVEWQFRRFENAVVQSPVKVAQHMVGFREWTLREGEKWITQSTSTMISKYEGVGRASLRVKSASNEDFGIYFCKVELGLNLRTAPASLGRKIEAARELSLWRGAAPLQALLNAIDGAEVNSLVVSEGVNEWLLTCRAPAAAPAAQIEWQKDGERIDEDVRNEQNVKSRDEEGNLIPGRFDSQSLLLLPNVDRRLSGAKITCVAANKFGTINVTKTIAVLYDFSAPKIEIGPGDWNADWRREGERFSISCSVEDPGNPRASLSLLRSLEGNENLINASSLSNGATVNSSAIFVPGELIAAKSDNNATYACRASSPNLTLQTNVSLNVAFGPKTTSLRVGDEAIVEEIVVEAALPTTFACVVSDFHPDVDVRWLLNGEPLDGTSFVTFETDGRVVSRVNWTPTPADDASIMTCDAANSVFPDVKSNVSVQATVTFAASQARLTIKEKNDDGLFAEGATVAAECSLKVYGNPPANLSVFLGEERLSSHSLPEPLLVNFTATRSRSGLNVTCLAQQSIRNASWIASKTLQVIYGPDEAKMNGSLEAEADRGSIIIACSANGFPYPTFVWTKNSVVFTESVQSSRRRINNDAVEETISFVPTASDHGAIVGCVAVNPIDRTSLNASATLNVTFPPAGVKLEGMGNQAGWILENSTLSLSCSLTTPGNPPASIRLSIDGETLDMSRSQRQVRINASLDGALVLCVAESSLNDLTLEDSRTIQIARGPDSIQLLANGQAGNASAMEGRVVRLDCKVEESRPGHSVRWFVNGEERSGSESGSTLFFTMGGNSKYVGVRCLATNDAVDVKASAQFWINLVIAPKVDPQASTEYFVDQGGLVSIRCPLMSDPPPFRFSWRQLGVALETIANDYGDEMTLVLRNVTRDMFGLFACNATNPYGTGEATVRVVPSVPDAPVNCTANAGQNEIVINCIAGWNGGAAQTFICEVYELRMVADARVRREAAVDDREWILVRTQTSSQPNFVMSGLRPETTYRFLVFSKAASNSSDRSNRGDVQRRLEEYGDYLTMMTAKPDNASVWTVIVGGVVGGVVFLIVLAVLAMGIVRYRKKRYLSNAWQDWLKDATPDVIKLEGTKKSEPVSEWNKDSSARRSLSGKDNRGYSGAGDGGDGGDKLTRFTVENKNYDDDDDDEAFEEENLEENFKIDDEDDVSSNPIYSVVDKGETTKL